MSSSENESQTKAISSDVEQENEYDGMNKLMGNLAPYDNEPEWAISSWSEETESSENETSSNNTTSENKNDQLGRVGNKDWCKCAQCKREIWEIDSLYCTEVPAITEDKFEGKKCIILAHKFELLCLNKTILKIVLVGLNENDKDLQNRSLHFAACKQFIWWFFSIWAKEIDKLSRPVYHDQLENFLQRHTDSILRLKKVKEIDLMHIQYIKLKH